MLMMSKRYFITSILIASIIGGFIAVAFLKLFSEEKEPYQSIKGNQTSQFSNFLADSAFTVPAGINFVFAAKNVTPGVVFVRSTYYGSDENRSFRNPFDELYDYFKDQNRPRNRGEGMSSGSGVIISEDGYIVTNNHVVENADNVEVTLSDNRVYDAKVIGIDPTTDLALLKIDGEGGFPAVAFGDSDAIQIGEWVLAIGNPFGTLTSTVTAGIVSAKARNINILYDRNGHQIEAFIQTDAAVNQGNSGGALVNLKGELVGINTAIATQTGSYSGYSFAVPASLVKKVMEDLLEFGVVQRALLGVSISPVTAQLVKEEGLIDLNGVYVGGVGNGSAASEGGIKPGDVILEINEMTVNSVSELQELVARNRPGDVVTVTFRRGEDIKEVQITLKNTMGDTEIVRKVVEVEIEGSFFSNPNQNLRGELGIEGGAQISEIGPGKWADEGFKEGFVITSVDKEKIDNPEELEEILTDKTGGILIEGFYQDGSKEYFGLSWK